MARITQYAVVFALLTAMPTANAGILKSIVHAGKDADAASKAAKAEEVAKDAEINVKGISADATGLKVDTDVGGPGVQVNATGASVDVNGVKVENKVGGGIAGGGGSSSDNDTPWWFYVLFFLAIGGWILSKFRRKRS